MARFQVDALGREPHHEEHRRRAQQRALKRYTARAASGNYPYALSNYQHPHCVHYADCRVLVSLDHCPNLISRAELVELRRTTKTKRCGICLPDIPPQPDAYMRRLIRLGRIKSGTGWPSP